MKKYILILAILAVASCTAPVEEPKGSWFLGRSRCRDETFVAGPAETTQMFIMNLWKLTAREILETNKITGNRRPSYLALPDGSS